MKNGERLCVVVGLNSPVCLLGRVLLEIIVAVQHSQRHDGADSPNALNALDRGDGGVEGLEGVVEKCVEVGIIVENRNTLRVTVMIMTHYDH